MTWELEGKEVLGKMLRDVGSLVLIAKTAWTMDEEGAIRLARRLRWLRDDDEAQVDDLKLAA